MNASHWTPAEKLRIYRLQSKAHIISKSCHWSICVDNLPNILIAQTYVGI